MKAPASNASPDRDGPRRGAGRPAPPARRVRVTPAALRRGADAQRERARLLSRPAVRIALLAIGLLAIVALVRDMGTVSRLRASRGEWDAEDIASLGLGLSDARHVDPAGRFAVTLPSAWRAMRGEDVGTYAARFIGPRDIELSIRIAELPHGRFERLLRDTAKLEDDWGIPMNIRTNDLRGRPCIERTCRLVQQGVFAVDFLVGRTAHHLQFVAPREVQERLMPLFRDILATYDPEPRSDVPPPAVPVTPPAP